MQDKDTLTLSEPILARVVAELESVGQDRIEQVERWVRSFAARFPLERLGQLEGHELLVEMHGRESRDCLAYWLEFKNDEHFNSRPFGSISGGSAFKFGLYQRAADGAWVSGSPHAQRELTEAEAADVAASQRDEILRAAAVVRRLPDDPHAEGYLRLQQDIERVAPSLHQLAFFHKLLFLYYPERLDNYHSTAHQRHILCQLGIVPPDSGRYASARFFVAALQQLRAATGQPLPMGMAADVYNRLFGSPIGHWRIGTGDDGAMFPLMRDQELVAIGWGRLGDLADLLEGMNAFEAKAKLKESIAAAYPERTDAGQIGRDAAQVWNFFGAIKEGDRVYAANGKRVLGVGEVIGRYVHEPDETGYAHRRRVRWLSTEPFEDPDGTGLRKVVYPLAKKGLALQAAAARHLHAAPSAASPATPRQRPRAAAMGILELELERKGQVILHGPPGTGKTFQAMQAARDLVARGCHGTTWGDLPQEVKRGLRGEGDADAQRIWTCTFHPAFSYEDFVEGLRPVAAEDGGLRFPARPGMFKDVCARAARASSEPHVLLIDEFNRGDAPRIFGELLTLIELDKREHVFVTLPSSGERFTVPRNLRVLATMNTADRSIALLDAALRRRFGFVELLPDPRVLEDTVVGGISLASLLGVLNRRLLENLGSSARNLQVGHAYFMHEGRPLSTARQLQQVMLHDVLPLLQEYCTDDPELLGRLVGEHFYDTAAQRFRQDVFTSGRVDEFVEALIDWDADALGSTEASPQPEVEELDDSEDDDDSAEDGDAHGDGA